MTQQPELATLTHARKSHVTGIVWPTISGSHRGALQTLMSQMELSQWLPESVIRERQSLQLGELLAHAQRHCPFYRDRLPIDLAAWDTIALLTRRDLQNNFDTLLADTYPLSHGKTFDIATGGSTGEPVTVRRTRLTQLFWEAATQRDHFWHQREFSATMAIIRQFTGVVDTGKPGRWGGNLRGGPAWHLPISTDVDTQLRWLQSVNPDILLTYPSNLESLITRMQCDGITLPRLREVRTISGTVTPFIREFCQSVLGVPLIDIYSAQEVGIIALQCPQSGLLHVQSEHLLVEILDEQDRPCRDGEIGQVVVTDLHNFSMPLIRYTLRDWAEVGPACSCGRGLFTLRRIVGRVRNMAFSPGGKKFWPVLETKRFLKSIPHLKQYQFIQIALDTIKVTLVCAPEPSDEQLKHFQTQLEEMFGHAYRWIWNIQETSIPPTPSGKFEEFVSSLCDVDHVSD